VISAPIGLVLDRPFTGEIRAKRALSKPCGPWVLVPALPLVMKATHDLEARVTFFFWAIEVRFMTMFLPVKRLVALASSVSKDEGASPAVYRS